MSRSAAVMVLSPMLTAFAGGHPDAVLDVVTSTGPVDLVAGEFDAGIQLGEFIQKYMVAAPVSPRLRLAAVGSVAIPRYEVFSGNQGRFKKSSMRKPRLPGGPYRWEFEQERKAVTVGVNALLIVDETNLVIRAGPAGAGIGLAYEEETAEYVSNRRLMRVLQDWSPRFPGFFTYQPESSASKPALCSCCTGQTRRRPLCSFEGCPVSIDGLCLGASGAKRERRTWLND